MAAVGGAQPSKSTDRETVFALLDTDTLRTSACTPAAWETVAAIVERYGASCLHWRDSGHPTRVSGCTGRPLLSAVVAAGNAALCRRLLELGADPEKRCTLFNRTAVHWALHWSARVEQRIAVLSVLVQAGADMNVVEWRGLSLLRACIHAHDDDTVAWLLTLPQVILTDEAVHCAEAYGMPCVTAEAAARRARWSGLRAAWFAAAAAATDRPVMQARPSYNGYLAPCSCAGGPPWAETLYTAFRGTKGLSFVE